MTVKAIVLAGYGQNCDIETAYAFELAGAKAARVHINTLIEKPDTINDFDVMAFGGGFSWGDDHGAGVVQATRMKTHLGERLVRFIESGKLVIGICNGFQCFGSYKFLCNSGVKWFSHVVIVDSMLQVILSYWLLSYKCLSMSYKR